MVSASEERHLNNESRNLLCAPEGITRLLPRDVAQKKPLRLGGAGSAVTHTKTRLLLLCSC